MLVVKNKTWLGSMSSRELTSRVVHELLPAERIGEQLDGLRSRPLLPAARNFSCLQRVASECHRSFKELSTRLSEFGLTFWPGSEAQGPIDFIEVESFGIEGSTDSDQHAVVLGIPRILDDGEKLFVSR